MVSKETIAKIEKLLLSCWKKETAAPGCQAVWTEQNPAWGQCAVTALLVQNLLGGELIRTAMDPYGSHYYNRLPDGTEVDLTFCQFPAETVFPPGQPAQRDYVLYSERARSARSEERYRLLAANYAVASTVDRYPKP